MAKRYTLTKPQRAAAVLVAMGKSRASQLLKFFKSDELRVMIDAAHTLKTIPQPDLEELVKEFEAEFAVGAGLMDSAETMQKILGEALSEEEMFAITGRSHDLHPNEPELSVWEKLPKVDTDELVAFLGNESPQLCAVVLSRMDSKIAAAIIEKLEPGLRKATVARLLSSKDVPDPVLGTVENRLEEVFDLSGNTAAAGEGASRLADILNQMQKEVSDDLLEQLTPLVGEKKVNGVKSKLFRFEDIPSLSKESRTALCDGLSTEVLTIALRGADDELKEAVLSSISQRTRRMIESELEAGKAKASEIEQARKSIATLALRMAQEGRIDLQHSEEEAA
ncbi:FliG C-terminal domain-containing protein [Oricola thermophila]|uniref:Flagellar motor switch protein FliG n=1 Tax=Oricola thermophila TaxID=2742145 RepID=A0A6N1VIU5_9HYPH|nr:FliG C-terminal domain-containing protein [Oricola thermophila]QKV19655.1 flagellar motor switch protein FliG [Oricola thermophila]